MSIEVKLPELGENISSGDLLKVLVKVGEKINKDQALLELETDKAAIEVPSPTSGVVRQIHVKEGQKLKVGQVIISLDENGAKPPNSLDLWNLWQFRARAKPKPRLPRRFVDAP